MVTPIQEWEPQVEDVTLPSGKSVKAKRPDLVAMISDDGDVPDLLSNLIVSLLTGSGGKTTFDLATMTPDQLKEMVKSANVIAKACFVEPQLWDNAQRDETHIPLAWVSLNDKAFIMGWALGGQYQPAKTFPAQPNGHVESIPAGKQLRRKP